MSPLIEQSKAYIFRICHVDNLPSVLANGLHCRNSVHCSPSYIQIGNPDLIDKRVTRPIPVPPGGFLSDYIPFYFTPYTPMLLNIKTGYNGVKQRDMNEIAILVSSLHRIAASNLQFVFSDRHAVLTTAQFSSDIRDLDRINWQQLRARDFKRDPEDPEKVERYQAEALIYQRLPITSLLGIFCYDEKMKGKIDTFANDQRVVIETRVSPTWYV